MTSPDATGPNGGHGPTLVASAVDLADSAPAGDGEGFAFEKTKERVRASIGSKSFLAIIAALGVGGSGYGGYTVLAEHEQNTAARHIELLNAIGASNKVDAEYIDALRGLTQALNRNTKARR